ncbi:mCG145428, partial [Mus musculus]
LVFAAASTTLLQVVYCTRISLCSPGCPGTHSVDQADLELRNPPAFASQVLGLKARATTPGLNSLIFTSVFSTLFPLTTSCNF